MCLQDLEVFSQFRNDLSKKQNALYNLLKEKEPQLATKIFNEVKAEINEFINCNPMETMDEEDELMHPQVIIKSEIDDIEVLDYSLLEDSLQYASSSSWKKPIGKGRTL